MQQSSHTPQTKFLGQTRPLSSDTAASLSRDAEAPIPENWPRKRQAELEPDMQLKKTSLGANTIGQRGGQSGHGQDDVRDQILQADSLGLQRDRYTRYIGMTTEHESLLLDSRFYDNDSERTGRMGTFRQVDENEHFIQFPDVGTESYYHELTDLDTIERLVMPHGGVLVQLYFQIVHPSFPILDRSAFLERYTLRRRELAPPLLAAIYLLAMNWWYHSPELAHCPRPDLNILERLAYRTLENAMSRPKLSVVQAGLLLLQRPRRESPWPLTAQLIALGQDLGLHLDCTNWEIPVWEISLRKRLAWALFMQDVWSASIFGRPRHISDNNWAVPPLTPSDFSEAELETSSPSRSFPLDDPSETLLGQSIFLQMISLTQILSSILETLYTQSANRTVSSSPSPTTTILTLAKPLQLRLRSWFSSLPDSLALSNITPPQPSSLGSLHLSYYAIEILLHRKIIRSLPPPGAPPAPGPPVALLRSAARARLISFLSYFNLLRPSHLRGFWYFPSRVNFASIATFCCLLLRTSESEAEREFYGGRVREYRWTLGVSREGEGEGGVLDLASEVLEESVGVAVDEHAGEEGEGMMGQGHEIMEGVEG